MRDFAAATSTTTSPQKSMSTGKYTARPGTGASAPHKLTYSQRKAVEKEDEEYNRMFQLFDSKADIQYLDSYEEDKLAATVYGDAKIGKSKNNKNKSKAKEVKPHTSGYDFDAILKNDDSWRKL